MIISNIQPFILVLCVLVNLIHHIKLIRTYNKIFITKNQIEEKESVETVDTSEDDSSSEESFGEDMTIDIIHSIRNNLDNNTRLMKILHRLNPTIDIVGLTINNNSMITKINDILEDTEYIPGSDSDSDSIPISESDSDTSINNIIDQ